MNTRNRQMNPTQPFIFLHCVDEHPISTIPAPLDWDHTGFKTSEFHYTEGDNRVSITKFGTGIYEITVSLCVEIKTGAPTHSIIELYVNGVILDCGVTHGYTGAAGHHSNATIVYPVYLTPGDYVQVYASVDNGTGIIEANTGRFQMKGIPMEGWNNKRAGSSKYPFRQEG